MRNLSRRHHIGEGLDLASHRGSSIARPATGAHLRRPYRGVGLPAFAASITGSGSAAFWITGVLGVAACALAYGLRHRLRAHPLHALALGGVLSVAAAPHIDTQDLSVLALPCIIVASRRGNVAMLIMLALSAIAAVGFLEIQQVLRPCRRPSC